MPGTTIKKYAKQRPVIFSIVLALSMTILPVSSFAQLTFIVNSKADNSDQTGANGACATGETIPGGDAECTLRAAIEEANSTPEKDTINFAIPNAEVHTILPGSALPIITVPVVIDGTTQLGYTSLPLIEIDGSEAAGGDVFGLEIRAGNSTIKGLAINNFADTGLVLQTGNQNIVQANHIGINATGDHVKRNIHDGIAIIDSSLNTIGGTSELERNVISGNNGFGIAILNSPSFGNAIIGNYIGTDVTGTNELGNGLAGVLISAAVGTTEFAHDNIIGGVGPGEGNVISGNIQNGIEIFKSDRNHVLGNLIGVNASGMDDLPNLLSGVRIQEGADNRIGAEDIAARNVISGNGGNGIVIGGELATGNTIIANFIGTNVDGTEYMFNGSMGVLLTSFGEGKPSSATVVGSDKVGFGNVISGNARDGIHIFESADNRIIGNKIGVSADGSIPITNFRHGVAIFDSSDNVIGGELPGESNTISANAEVGVFVKGKDVTGIIIRGNYIGTNSSDNEDIGNFSYGIHIKDTSGVKIGGIEEGQGNTIAFNGSIREQRGHGIVIDGGTQNAIRGNSVFENSGRGIDLVDEGFERATPYAFTIPDPANISAGTMPDADTGSNNLQNYAVVTLVRFAGAQKIVQWTLYGEPGKRYELDIYSNKTADPSGFGEGREYLKTVPIEIDSSGRGTWSEVFDVEGMVGPLLSTTATDPDNNTSEFSMIDTDGDAIADQWEERGIDIDEDGVIDFPPAGVPLPFSRFDHKDVFVEVDTMNCWRDIDGFQFKCVGIDVEGQAELVAAFANVPDRWVNNPDKKDGISLHLQMDEIIPHHTWVSTKSGDKNQGFNFFDKIKQNGSASAEGGFGTVTERLNYKTIAAKKLFYRYAIFADHFGKLDSDSNVQKPTSTSGLSEATRGPNPPGKLVEGANDFFVTLGLWKHGGTVTRRTGTFMHELGHSLGLMHGGTDDINYKPNYHSVMNYFWTASNSAIPASYRLDYSQRAFADLSEGSLNESAGLGGDAIVTKVGPPTYWPPGKMKRGKDISGTIHNHGHYAVESLPIDFDRNGKIENNATADINNLGRTDYNNDGVYTVEDEQEFPELLRGNEDWSSLRFNFIGTPHSADGQHDGSLIIEEITLDEALDLEGDADGAGTLGFEITQTAVNENAGSVNINVRRLMGSQGDISIDYQTMDISTTAGLDYTPVSGTLGFIDGENYRAIQIEIIDDLVAEDDEVLQIQLSNPQGGALIGADQFLFGIKKNDGPGDLQFTNPFFGEQEDAGMASITVVRTGGSNGSVEVDFETADDLALEGEDYTFTTGTLVFADGVTSQSFDVPITEDILIEGNEGIHLALSNSTGGAGLGSIDEATLTILNVPTSAAEFNFSLPVYQVGEADGVRTIEVIRTKVLDTAVSVDLVSADDTATMGEDYTQINMTLNFAADEISKSIDIPILNDILKEGIEVFDLSLVNPSSFALLGPISEAKIRIRDNDAITVINTNDGGYGSLEWAIMRANSSSDVSFIDFDIPGSGVHTIRPSSIMPPITEPVTIDGYTQFGSSPNTLDELSNAELRIELDGSLASGNSIINIQSPNVTIRGLVINRFRSGGIRIVNTNNAVIEGNFIGTDAKGLQPLLFLGSSSGVVVDTSNNNRIGGANPAARNLISGGLIIDGSQGIGPHGISMSDADGNVIMGNLIGVGADGRDIGNDGAGIQLRRSRNNTIGGPGEFEGNVIAFNRIAIFIVGASPTSTGNSVRGNSIYESDIYSLALLGSGSNFMMGWIYENDVGDLDEGGNLLQNYPVIGDVQSASGETTFTGYLASAVNTTFTLDFYSSPSIHRDGYGEGKNYLGSGSVTTNEDGTGLFNITLPVDLAPGEFITATATDPGQNTSPFSLRQAVGTVLTQILVVNSTNDVDDGFCNTDHCSLHEAIRAANNYAGPNTINFAIPGAGPHTISPTGRPKPITESVLIDGYSQPGASANTLLIGSNANLLIEIDGTVVNPPPPGARTGPPIPHGLDILGQDTTIRGLVFNRFELSGAITMRGSGHRIEGNFLATDVTGTTFLGRGTISALSSSSQTTIGGSDIKHRNLIAGGVTIHYGSGPGQRILGNLIGTDITGSFLLVPNSASGIDTSADGVVIGGSGPGEGNVIASGISIDGDNTIVQGNLIGTDATGTLAIARQLSFINGIHSTIGTQIGGSLPGEGNVISGHGGHGIVVGSGPPIEQNFIQGNFIGTDRSGTLNLGNKLDGIHARSSSLVIGGETPGSANIIAHNGGAGVSTDKINTLISQNSIYDNGGLGIDLNSDGVTANDEGDTDTGGNNRQNFPVLDVVTAMNGETTITGSLSSMADTSYRLEFFSNENADASGYGEGMTFIGSADVVTDNAGDVEFSPVFPGELSLALAVTATATDPDGNTSEFSFRRAVGGADISADLSVSQTATPEPLPLEVPVTFTVTVTNNGPDLASGVILSNSLYETGAVSISAESENGSCSFANYIVTCPIGILPVGESAEVTISYIETFVHTLASTMIVTGNQPDPDALNSSNTIEVEMIDSADLTIIKSADPMVVSDGEEVTYTLTVKHLGPSFRVALQAIDELPAGFTAVSVDSNRSDCSITGNTITCDYDSLYKGDIDIITIVAVASGDGPVTNTAELFGDAFDPDELNNSASVEIMIGAEVGIFKDSFEDLEQN